MVPASDEWIETKVFRSWFLPLTNEGSKGYQVVIPVLGDLRKQRVSNPGSCLGWVEETKGIRFWILPLKSVGNKSLLDSGSCLMSLGNDRYQILDLSSDECRKVSYIVLAFQVIYFIYVSIELVFRNYIMCWHNFFLK